MANLETGLLHDSSERVGVGQAPRRALQRSNLLSGIAALASIASVCLVAADHALRPHIPPPPSAFVESPAWSAPHFPGGETAVVPAVVDVQNQQARTQAFLAEAAQLVDQEAMAQEVMVLREQMKTLQRNLANGSLEAVQEPPSQSSSPFATQVSISNVYNSTPSVHITQGMPGQAGQGQPSNAAHDQASLQQEVSSQAADISSLRRMVEALQAAMNTMQRNASQAAQAQRNVQEVLLILNSSLASQASEAAQAEEDLRGELREVRQELHALNSTLDALADDECTCHIQLDNYIKKVYVDGADMTASLSGGPPAASYNNNPFVGLSFRCGPQTLLAVEGADAESGCATGGFQVRCSSTSIRSGWDGLETSTAWKSWGGPRSGHGVASPPAGWYQPNFDDSAWDQASLEQGIHNRICDANGPGWLFRSPRNLLR